MIDNKAICKATYETIYYVYATIPSNREKVKKSLKLCIFINLLLHKFLYTKGGGDSINLPRISSYIDKV